MSSDRVLLTIHGVVSDNTGLSDMREECERRIKGLVVDSYFYERILPWRDLTKATRELIFTSVRDKIELTWYRDVAGKNKKLFIVAHSFGTLAVLKALESHLPGVEIEGLILLGSVIPRAQLWDGFIKSGLLKNAPLAIIRPWDCIVPCAYRVGGESSGSNGFITNGQYRVLQSYKSGGHTAYYPHDVGDVVTAIRHGVHAVSAVSERDWKSSCRWISRKAYDWLYRPFRLLFNGA